MLLYRRHVGNRGGGGLFELRHETKRRFERQDHTGRITASQHNLQTKTACRCFCGSARDSKAAASAIKAQSARGERGARHSIHRKLRSLIRLHPGCLVRLGPVGSIDIVVAKAFHK